MNGSNEEDDDDDNWTVDTSEDAIKARQVEGLSQGIKGKHIFLCTSKSFSEPLILASTNPRYELRVQYTENCKLSTCCVHKLF